MLQVGRVYNKNNSGTNEELNDANIGQTKQGIAACYVGCCFVIDVPGIDDRIPVMTITIVWHRIGMGYQICVSLKT